MSERIEITCPRCKHTWSQPLDEIERVTTGYRADSAAAPIETYRAQCPVDGTYVIVEVQEDGHG